VIVGLPHTLPVMRARFSRFLALLVACGVVALAVVVSDRRLPDLPRPPAQLPAAVVTLGDSTLSGEGGGHYDAGTSGENGNWCHRSPAAAINQARLAPTVARINLACSGVQADRVGSLSNTEGTQAQQLADLTRRFRVTDVIVQIGANDDPGFGDTVNRCVSAWAARSTKGCANELRTEWPKRVERMQPKVLDALRDVRAVMDRAGYLPGSYSLIVQSYASPVGPGIPPALQNLSGCPLLTEDLKWIRDTAVPELSAGLREVSRQVGARYLDLSRAGYGHEACTGGSSANNEWFTRLTVDWDALKDDSRAPHAMQESFHANATGHAQLGRCLGDFLAGRENNAVCLSDQRGNLEAVPERVAAQATPP
jgi:hypothetical protein